MLGYLEETEDSDEPHYPQHGKAGDLNIGQREFKVERDDGEHVHAVEKVPEEPTKAGARPYSRYDFDSETGYTDRFNDVECAGLVRRCARAVQGGCSLGYERARADDDQCEASKSQNERQRRVHGVVQRLPNPLPQGLSLAVAGSRHGAFIILRVIDPVLFDTLALWSQRLVVVVGDLELWVVECCILDSHLVSWRRHPKPALAVETFLALQLKKIVLPSLCDPWFALAWPVGSLEESPTITSSLLTAVIGGVRGILYRGGPQPVASDLSPRHAPTREVSSQNLASSR
eukprot:scaffold203_cov386-Prasinococcus_capsulatus_cf.AAC.14